MPPIDPVGETAAAPANASRGGPRPLPSTRPADAAGVQLLWPGKFDEHGCRRSPGSVPIGSHEVLTRFGEGPSACRLIHADFRTAVGTIEPHSIDFAYVDPPFGTDRDRFLADTKGIVRAEHHQPRAAYCDRWSTPEYLDFLDDLIALTRPLLCETGSLAVHVDHRASAHVRCLLDEHFGADRFINELIWKYGLGNATASRHFLRKHDTILVYGLSPRHFFNRQRGPITQAQQRKYHHEDERGRYMMSYGKRYDLKGGKPLESVLDIPSLGATDGERCGYPTQKPLRLLEVLLESFCPPGGIVLDPCGGSGTTAVAAQRSGRAWIAIDASQAAIESATQRLAAETACAFAIERVT